MTVAQLAYQLQQLDQEKELLGKFSGVWHEINLSIFPCPDWPEYSVRVEALSPKTLDGY